MTGLVVTGYASLDYPVGLSGQIGGDRTTLIDHRDPAAWPRIGGCPAYMALAVTREGGSVSPLTWIGTGAESDHFVGALRDAGADIGGIASLPSERTPTAILAYQADGTCACLFDPVFAGEETLTQAQRDLLAGADHLCISVGPPHLTREILACRKASARLYWVIKNDAHSFFPEICGELSSAADVIFCNEAERSLVAETPPETTIVETRGLRGIAVECEGQVQTLTIDPLAVRDTTGAGDTLAGGFIAAQMAGTMDALAATQAGLDAANKMLKQRQERQTS
ncbi:carbohydrate kinase family protein [Hoeflea poritis]|uniref:PfkB family carbohydrate kinase n=1 Tax=Hoeflea poritis TaxID=2993659 RepID=A0ABT4VK05_9HYPH|nr:PfkB family carbohydrate kinase [Hoeflea poritis]MDA4845024.1 PfkB family carbohydrate kinase [Hoeflea poritis]